MEPTCEGSNVSLSSKFLMIMLSCIITPTHVSTVIKLIKTLPTSIFGAHKCLDNNVKQRRHSSLSIFCLKTYEI